MEDIQFTHGVHVRLTGLPAADGNTTLYLLNTSLKNRRYFLKVD